MKAFYLDNIDVATLMKALDECKGNVILLTDEGDRFNLKSKLSQITGIMKLIEGGIVCNAKISCSDPDDEAFPEKVLHDLAGKEHVKHFLDIEMSSTGQMIEDIRLAVEGQKPISYLGHAGGVMPTVEEIADAVREALK